MPGFLHLRKAKWLWAIFVATVAWVLFLRAPSFGVPVWNVDESIHAAVAQRLLDGGSLYQDAIDQRTPVSYYFFEAVFAIFGRKDLVGVRAIVAVMIGLTAALVFALGRRAPSRTTAWWSVLLFVALSTNLLGPSDAYAANTEWFVILFTSAGACCLWLALEKNARWLAFVSGGSFALGFLSKQPALLDALPPLALLVYGAWLKTWTRSTGVRMAIWYAAGFAAVLAATVAHFAWHGTLGPAFFYTWRYNVQFYGPEISSLDRALTLLVPFRLLTHTYPWLLLVSVGALLAAAVRLVQFSPAANQRSGNPWILFVLLWFASSLAGATAGGRGFEHYYIQWIPAASLLAAWALGSLTEEFLRRVKTPRKSLQAFSWCATVLLALGAVHLVARPVLTRRPPAPPPDPALRASEFIRAHSLRAETIFVWGYNPDIYLYSQRRPASRFVYCSFLTGLIPWTNLAPEKDTSYAIVPGAMEELLADLQKSQPAFIVDCSAGPHRRFEKYPLANFAPLRAYVAEHYVEVESAQFVPQGFRLHLIKDAAQPRNLNAASAPPFVVPAPPKVFADSTVSPTPSRVLVSGEDSSAQLRGLELWVDDRKVDGVSFVATKQITVGFLVPYDRLGLGTHRLKAIARGAGGTTTESAIATVVCEDSTVTPEKLALFSVPASGRSVEPLVVRAPFGPSSGWEDGRRMYSLHATSSIVFPLDNVAQVQGEFGIRAGAYAKENGAPTDGAEFVITWLGPTTERQVLFRRTLRPREESADRGPQAFNLDLPAALRTGRIEFGINPGPAGNAASDWTYWANLLLHGPR
jgi:4-amino-4-deoxy-L-arabinose transferase-like glycosyltransferase